VRQWGAIVKKKNNNQCQKSIMVETIMSKQYVKTIMVEKCRINNGRKKNINVPIGHSGGFVGHNIGQRQVFGVQW